MEWWKGCGLLVWAQHRDTVGSPGMGGEIEDHTPHLGQPWGREKAPNAPHLHQTPISDWA